MGPAPWDYFPGWYDLISQDYVDKKHSCIIFSVLIVLILGDSFKKKTGRFNQSVKYIYIKIHRALLPH